MSIYTRQNEKGMLNLLKVQRCLYTKAKVIYLIVLFVSLAVMCSFLIATSFFSNDILNACSIFFGILITFILFSVELYVSHLKWLAASVQQKFDSYVLGIDESVSIYRHNRLRRIDRETLIKLCSRYENTEVDKIENWYSDYSNLNKETEILMCQKENVRWDSSLRKMMLITIAIVSFIIIGLIIFISILSNASILKFFAIISWILPVFEVSIIVIKTLIQDLLRLSNIKTELDKAESDMSEEDLYIELSEIQALIFEHRQKCFLIPNWLYNISRNKKQKEEDAIASNIKNK